jgi:signal transduction histidine kinase
VISRVVRAVWDEQRVPAPPSRPWWDVALVAALVPTALIEGIARDVPSPPYSIGLAMVCVVAVLWRRQYPLAMLLVAFGAQTLAGVGPALAGLDYFVLDTTAVVLLFPYSLARWASGRHILVGLVLMLAAHYAREPLYGSTAQDNLIGAAALLLPAAFGLSVRFWVTGRARESEQVRLRERQNLARDLHDTVAHHVSGIVIQSQAGQAVAASDPQRAIEVLAVIEKEATRALGEMRSLVGVLREGEAAQLSPAGSIAALQHLATAPHDGPHVHLVVTGNVDGIDTAVDAAVYRVVQESVTNTRWHAHSATRIDVLVQADEGSVHVDVSDDGSPSRPAGRPTGRGAGSGFGIAGMRERVELLGGRLAAGPRSGGGWAVSATIPRTVST